MKFPRVTVILVAAALMFVVWEQTRERPDPTDPQRFANLAANPVERSAVVDWAATQVPQLCREATGQSDGGEAYAACMKRSNELEPACRRAAYDRFPGFVASDAMFRDLSLSMMACLVPQSRPVD